MKALLPITLTILLSRTICAIDNALKAYENNEGQLRRWIAADEDDDGTDKVPTVRSAPSLQSLGGEETEEQEQFRPAYHQQMDELPSDRMNEFPSDRMNEFPSDRMNEFPSDRMNEFPSDRMNKLPSDRMNELPRDDGRGTMVDVDIVKGHKGLRMREDEELVDELGDEEDSTSFGLPLGEEAEERRAKVPSPALSLVPKRRRRIGTIGGWPSTKSAIRKYGKMAKSSIPVIFPDSGGIDLNVQSDFVEKNDDTTTEASTTTPTTSSTTTEQQQKPKKFKEEEEEKKRSNSTILYGRDFWANALRTLLIEFRKLHPELASGRAQQARRRAGLRTNSTSNSSTTGTSIVGGNRKPKPKEGEGEGGTTDGAWRGTDNRLDE
ncbi:hypothetical protein GPALN_007921 [Globodera pallida]|nr:hypothetical protein GPALN_007921 [Globodera pallida]